MADETRDHLLDHSYDGIQEYDNPMPRWWVITFWATIIFAVVYALNIGGIGVGEGRIAAYEKDMAAFRAAHPVPESKISPEELLALAGKPDEVAQGKAVFTKNCIACHGPDGGGLIGPNLTDDYWLHGGKIEEIHTTIFNGVLDKGMPPWGKILQPAEINAVTTYVWSLHGTTPAKPKEPQGELTPR
jgi:cytochrome c oxidase cbb3-type subunit 3